MEKGLVLPAESYICGSGKIFLPERPTEETQKVTCRVAVVNPGFPDAVIKVYPAEHEKEYVWVDRQPGIERWEDIKRLMDQYGPRNKRIPNPIPLHSNPKEAVTPTVKESDIPTVELSDGQILKAPPKVFLQPDLSPKSAHDELETMESRITKLESGVNLALEVVKQTAESVDRLAKIIENKTEDEGEEKRGPGRPKKE